MIAFGSTCTRVLNSPSSSAPLWCDSSHELPLRPPPSSSASSWSRTFVLIAPPSSSSAAAARRAVAVPPTRRERGGPGSDARAARPARRSRRRRARERRRACERADATPTSRAPARGHRPVASSDAELAHGAVARGFHRRGLHTKHNRATKFSAQANPDWFRPPSGTERRAIGDGRAREPELREGGAAPLLRLWLVRHGQTAANRQGIIQGQQDWPPTRRGSRRRGRVGPRFGRALVARLLVRPRARARDGRGRARAAAPMAETLRTDAACASARRRARGPAARHVARQGARGARRGRRRAAARAARRPRPEDGRVARRRDGRCRRGRGPGRGAARRAGGLSQRLPRHVYDERLLRARAAPPAQRLDHDRRRAPAEAGKLDCDSAARPCGAHGG